MRELEDSLRFTQELMLTLVGMAMVSPLWLYYLFIKGFHTYLLQTLGVSDDPLGFIRLSSALLAGLGMVIPLYEVAQALNDVLGAWEGYV